MMTASLGIRASLLTDTGRLRSLNQDTLGSCEPSDRATLSRYGRLYIVADGAGGVGGSRAGQLASRYAAAKVLDLYYRSSTGGVGRRLRTALLQTNAALREHARRPGRTNQMATTLVAAVVRGAELTVANVGDSRAYLMRGSTIRQLTQDHSLVAGLVADGAITPEEAVDHPQRNVILYSLGSAPTDPRVDIYTRRLRLGDTVLLCTDGLTRYANDEQLLTLLQGRPEDQAAQRLIDFANAAGGADNVSVAVLRVEGGPLPRWLWWLLLLGGVGLILLSGLLGLALVGWKLLGV